MPEPFAYYNRIIVQVENYLYVNLNFTPIHIEFCRRDWNRIRLYLISKEYNDISLDQEQEIRNYFTENNRKGRLASNSERMMMSITAICEFISTGKISIRTRCSKKDVPLLGPIGSIIENFLVDQRKERRLSYIRLSCYKRQMTKFYIFCQSKGVGSANSFDFAFFISYINQLDTKYRTHIETAIGVLKVFTKYLFITQQIPIDHSFSIPKYKSIYQPKISSTYSKEEIETLVESVDRTSPGGKRNYAMIVLMARLGLRASDVGNLRFECLDWKSNTITLNQIKTGKELTLPLLPEVGNAIIDYLKYGRPVSDEDFIFLSCNYPHSAYVTGNAIGSRIRDIFKASGIRTSGKKYGTHALRHSLGFRLLQESNTVHVISQILGHKNTKSTKYYLRIDIDSMKHCLLEVPLVDKEFYEQKQNLFYG